MRAGSSDVRDLDGDAGIGTNISQREPIDCYTFTATQLTNIRMLWVLALPASIISAPTIATSALRVCPFRGASLLHAYPP